MDSLTVTCVEGACRKPFEITAGEQQFFQTKGYAIPKRCKACRAQRKLAKGPATPEVVAGPAERWVGGSDAVPGPRRNKGNRYEKRRRDTFDDGTY